MFVVCNVVIVCLDGFDEARAELSNNICRQRKEIEFVEAGNSVRSEVKVAIDRNAHSY